MGTATQYTDFSDLYVGLENATREDTGSTATENQAKRYINVALHDMHIGYTDRYPWAERKATIRTQAAYTTGTVTVTKGSTTVTGSGTAWNTNNDFGVANARATGKVKIGSEDSVYEVDSVSSDTSLTLTQPYVGDDDSGLSYTYYEDEYALASDFLRPIDQRRFADTPAPITLIGRTEFRRRYPRNYITGTPSVATIVDRAFSGNTTPVRRIMFHKPPENAILIPYNYVTSNLAVTSSGTAQTQLVNDDDEPIVPLRYRHAILLHALYHWYRDKRDDARSQEVKAEYTDIMLRVASDFEIGQSRPNIRPRVSHYVRRARRPWGGTHGRRYDVNGAFDRLE